MVLVTGATGLVGSHLLAKLLSKDVPVRAIYRTESSLEKAKRVLSHYFPDDTELHFSKIDWIKADITNIPFLDKAFEGISKVYHCAGLVSFSPSDRDKLRKINIEGTANIVNLCLKHKIEKLCHVSSIAALGKAENGLVSEDSLFDHNGKHSAYAITKFGAEMEVWRGGREGLDVVIVNPGIIIGPGHWGSGSGLLFEKVHSGLNYYPTKTTGFISVKDTVAVMVELMDNPIKNEGYILVSENLDFKTLLSQIADSLGKPHPKKELKPWMVFSGWLLEQVPAIFGRKRKIPKQAIRSMFEKTEYDSSKIQKELHFEFEPISKNIKETGTIYLKEKK